MELPPCFIQWSFDEKKPVAVSEYSLEKGILAEEDENPETLAELYFKFGFSTFFFLSLSLMSVLLTISLQSYHSSG